METWELRRYNHTSFRGVMEAIVWIQDAIRAGSEKEGVECDVAVQHLERALRRLRKDLEPLGIGAVEQGVRDRLDRKGVTNGSVVNLALNRAFRDFE